MVLWKERVVLSGSGVKVRPRKLESAVEPFREPVQKIICFEV